MHVVKRKKRLYFNMKSCTAMLLVVALLCTSVDYMQVQAEELEDHLPTVSEEELPGDSDVLDEETPDAEEGSFVKTSEGAVIISSFVSLSEKDAHIVLEKRETLEEVIRRMPATLQAYADVYVQGNPEPDEGEETGGDKGGETGGESGEAGGDEGGETGGESGETGGDESGETGGESGETGGDESGETGGESGETGGEGGETEGEAGDEEGKPNEGENQPGTDTEAEVDIASADREGHQWRLLVEVEDVEDESNDGTDEGDSNDGKDQSVSGNGTGTSEGDDTGADEPAVSTQPVEVEIPVSWECSDYENTELTEYIFRPVWDNALWFYESAETADSVPEITVSYVEIIKEEVSTQEELAAAFAAGVDKIKLTADIALTATLRLPASADIELDGQGYSLLRGKDENGLFIDTMISMDGEDYTEETYGILTLTDITVDGKTPADRAGAPVILDRGNLILEKNAVVRDNYNYGTYSSDGETILDYGGGIQVYGELSVTEESLVTGNFADEFGGGVYLADGATLYLYADVIRENSVSDDAGYGADLYAARGSTIYYDSSIDMERDGFYLCEGVILICMQGQDAVNIAETDRHDEKVEIFISAAEESGYDDKFLEALRKKLESEYGYSVIPKMAQVDTSDLRDWYVYDHYDTAAACWGTEMADDGYGNMVPKEWLSKYGDYPRRKYYSCTENYYNYTGTAVYSIADWLNNTGYVNGGGYSLAQFKEHIYNQNPDMTFAGYGSPAYIDFMFYDPQSNGEKIVDFDIDSSQVISHALSGMGFLVNTSVRDGKLYGYLVYYYYSNYSVYPGDIPTELYVFALNGVDVEDFHDGKCDFKRILRESQSESTLSDKGITIVGTPVSIDHSKWYSRMSIRIQVSPTKIEIRQQPEGAETDIGEMTPMAWTVEDKGCNGFGPLMAYTGHACSRASCFTFSNIKMRYTNPIQANQNMLQPIEFADYTQENTQKYFLNLFGTTDQGYNNEGVETDLYQEYLKLMQVEGVALITDRETPFEDYLGKSGEAGSNLCEIGKKGASALDVDTLAAKIHEYIVKQHTTYIQHKLSPDGSGELTNANPKQAVGNIWLEHEADDGQFSQVRDTLQGDSFTDEGYKIQIRDGIAYYDGTKDNYTVTYEVIKPNGDILKVSDSDPSFVVGTKYWEWPSGRYTVKQTIMGTYGESTVHGYAYFDLKRTVVENCSHVWGDPIRVEPGCTTEGSETRYCTECGMPRSVSIPALGHSISEEWKINPIEHWHECSRCNEKFDVDFHQFGKWITDEEATEDKDGSKYRLCAVCNYKELESIIRGKIAKREDCGENVPQTEISTELPALALAVLSEDDVHAVGNGTDITIVLTVDDADNTVSDADKQAVTSTAKSYKVAQYFDVNLYKEMNGGRSQLTETSDEIRLSMEIPEKYRKNARKYALVRVHDGAAIILPDLDSESSTVTIDTDRFSTYAFIYADRQKESENNSDIIEEELYPEQAESDYIVAIDYQGQKEVVPDSQKDSEPRTGQTSHVELFATMAFIEGASYLLFLFVDRHGMTEETKTELVSRLIRWAKQGGKLRRMLALAAIFFLLVYYHSIGKRVSVEWQQVCNE